MSRKPREDEEPVMGRDPLSDDEEILARTFYGAPEKAGRPAVASAEPSEQSPPPKASAAPRKGRSGGRRSTARRARSAAPSHYRIVSISLYNEDIEKIDGLVAELKAQGHSKANRSALIRYAIDTVDISKMPRSY